jgi:hypothetical protein
MNRSHDRRNSLHRLQAARPRRPSAHRHGTSMSLLPRRNLSRHSHSPLRYAGLRRGSPHPVMKRNLRMTSSPSLNSSILLPHKRSSSKKNLMFRLSH